ncbi:MAG: TraB/GumN family protein [Thermoplasmata archaeon]|jgi:pheromone shutdown protein TraB|nr:TraB/GumN family protein [Thermoplasmata archaeon]
MITLVGVGHVFDISDAVKKVIASRRPDIVCLELDPARYQSLMKRDTQGKVPLQYLLLSKIQKRMAGKFGSEVGNEMLAGVEGAKSVGARIALIDMNAQAVFGEIWRRMTFSEKVKLLGGALVGLFASKKTVERELESYSEDDSRYIEAMGKEFPVVKEVLIDRRNAHMAKQVQALSTIHVNIVAVVGDGHVPGMAEALKSLSVETIRLKELRDGTFDATGPPSYSYSFEYG